MVRVSSLDGQPVYSSYGLRSERSGRTRRSGRERWPMFRGRDRARSERSTYTYNDDVRSQNYRRTANNLLYGDDRGTPTSKHDRSAYSYGGGGHIHTRYNPTRSFGDDLYSIAETSSHRHHNRSRVSNLSRARSLVSHLSPRRGRTNVYADDARHTPQGSRYLDAGDLLGDVDDSKRTFPRFVLPGWAHMVVGLFLITVGIIDLVWTSVKYEGSCDFEEDATHDPCAAQNIYTYLAAPLWGGLVMMVVGSLTFTITPMRLLHNRTLYLAFIGGCIFLFVAICPAIISLGISNILENEDTFWANVKGRGLVLRDDVKFALIMVTVILGFIGWIISIWSLLVAFCAGPESQTDFRRGSFRSKSHKRRNYLDTTTLESNRHYPAVIPQLGTDDVAKSIDRRSRDHPTRLDRGDVIVHEEVIRPSSAGHRSRGTGSYYGDRITMPTSGHRQRDDVNAYYDDDIISVGDSSYSRVRPQQTRNERRYQDTRDESDVLTERYYGDRGYADVTYQ